MAIEPVTREEMLMSGQQLEPITRKELFLAKAAGMDVQTPEPITREEMFLSKISGGSGGGSAPVVEPLSVTENGTYTAPEGVDGYSPVTVNVAGGGGTSYNTMEIESHGVVGIVTVDDVEYNNCLFILLDIYPKTNATVNVTCLGLTKSITDTSGAENPEPQQISFGKFANIDDGLELTTEPGSVVITVEGDFYGIAEGAYTAVKSSAALCACIESVIFK